MAGGWAGELAGEWADGSRALAPFVQMAAIAARSLPPAGRLAELPGRGRMYVRAPRAAADAPPVVLLHGWIASGGLNWFQVFEPLREDYRVIAPDLRGHGRGIRSRRFRLADCADDVAALLRKRRLRGAIVVGYSMGGTVAQLLWRRHPELVGGLVLAATSARPLRNLGLGYAVMGLMESAALAGRAAALRRRKRGRRRPGDAIADEDRSARLVRWARQEVSRHDLRHLLEAGADLGRYDARPWLREIDVPTSVVVTDRDAVFPLEHQLALAKGIRGARVHKLAGGHLSFAKPAFGAAIRRAVDSVADRAQRRS